ncbi:MAG: methylated-DNA--[protein]-cysteine S-methyltransferase [Candidatus Marinimicrobia bacterium]|nr:methylated-DNA--[protein]-cysteine S-methyltransferase [Candidatus Neomarinimicrobiota bacterium]
MVLRYTATDSPVGRLYLAENNRYLCALSLGANAKESLFSYLRSVYPAADLQASKPAFSEVISQLNEYFANQRTDFDLPLIMQGTAFQKSVWDELLKIPYGRTVSYGELAERLDNPGAMRAVGAANGQNPIPIIIPCHRVIAADGSLGGYTGGLDIKHKLLELEQQKFTPSLF